MDKKGVVIVTGGAGYIGSHVCKMLYGFGYIPVVYDNLIYGHKDFVKWGPFEFGDILDSGRLSEVFEKYKPDAVFHFAAFAYVGESTINPAKYYQNNLVGTLSLLNAMLKANVMLIVFSSSCATFGIPKVIPINEYSDQNPINPYGRSKFFIEKILKEYDSAYGIKSIILRYFNAAGADPDGEIGEDHKPEYHLIPLILDGALDKKKEIIIFGDDYKTFDGTCIRDYIHVNDLARAHVLSLEYLMSEKKSNTFNLGLGYGFSVKQILCSAENISGQSINIKIGSRRDGDPPILIADSKKAQMELGWHAKYDEIDEIILHAWNWHRNRFLLEEIHE